MPPIRLSINKGIPQVPGDTRSFERFEGDALSLINQNGVALVNWVPQFAQIKGNAVYANSSLSSGRTPLALPYDNVTQTITISITGSNAQGRAFVERRLREFAQDAHHYWTTNWQINPVWLEWEQVLGKPQYTLITKIDVAWNNDAFDVFNTAEATITIEHLPEWQGIAPGDNPKRWAYIQNANPVGFTSSTCSLISTSNHLLNASLRNGLTWNGAHSPYRTEVARNFIDIPAGAVKGDAPAKIQLTLIIDDNVGNNRSFTRIYLWRSSRDLSVTDRNNVQYSNGYNISPGDNSANGSPQITSTAAETTFTTKMSWQSEPGPALTRLWLDKNLLRGKFMIFARMFATSGANGNVRARLRIVDQGSSTANTEVLGEEVNVRATTNMLHYMGVFNIPLTERAEMSPAGNGLIITSVPNAGIVTPVPFNIAFHLQFRNTAGANRDVFIEDLVLVPFDEAACLIKTPNYTMPNYLTVDQTIIMLDGTGYFNRGKTEAVGKLIGGATTLGSTKIPADYGGEPVEIVGELPTLVPDIAQRLYVMVDNPSLAVGGAGTPTINTYLNIVPQWRGIRDF